MSELRYCLRCGEACENIMVQTDQQTHGFLASSTVTQGIFWCVNGDCARHGLAAMLTYSEKPKHTTVTDLATSDASPKSSPSNPPKEPHEN